MMNKSKKHLLFWILFPIGWLLITALLVFYYDLANGPLFLFIIQLVILVAFFIVRVLLKNKRFWMRLLSWVGFISLTIGIIGFNKPSVERKSAAYYKNPELISEVLNLNQGKVQGFYSQDEGWSNAD